MNFDAVENLNSEQLMNLYGETIESPIKAEAVFYCYQACGCSNGFTINVMWPVTSWANCQKWCRDAGAIVTAYPANCVWQ